MKHFAFISFLVIIIGSGLTSCVKEKSFPATPVIEFKSFTTYRQDSADCIIKFKDGDGDIGAIGEDSNYNLKMKFLWKDTVDGIFKPIDADITDTTFDTLYYPYLIKNITPDGQYKALDGEIKMKLRSHPIYGPAQTNQVVKFEMRLTDRAGHISNMVSTNEIVVP